VTRVPVATMRAALCGDVPGQLDVVYRDVPLPLPAAEEVQVRVRAAALNRADLAMASGLVHGSAGGPGTPLGMEWAGEVTALGTAVTGFQLGQAVMGSGRGAFAPYAVADQGRVMALPQADMSFEQAAMLPVALQTMHDALVGHGGLQAGQAVLIQGASSGVGLMGLRMARVLGAGLVIGSSTDPVRRAGLLDMGAQLAIDSRDPDWPAQVLAATGGAGVNLVVDMLAGPVMNANLTATALGGRIVNVGRLAGRVAPFDFDLHALRRIQYLGVTFRTRTVAQVRALVAHMQADLGPALAAGELSLPLAARYAFDDLPQALAHMAANRHFGKIVVTMP
jgi:NADPH:quinone reductase